MTSNAALISAEHVHRQDLLKDCHGRLTLATLLVLLEQMLSQQEVRQSQGFACSAFCLQQLSHSELLQLAMLSDWTWMFAACCRSGTFQWDSTL